MINNKTWTNETNFSSLSSSAGDNHGRSYTTGNNDCISLVPLSNYTATRSNTQRMPDNDRCVQERYRLLTDAAVQVCRVPHGKRITDKIRFSRCFQRWQDHHISLEQSEIISTKNKEYMDRSITYSSISVCYKFKVIDWHYPFRIRIVTNNYIYFFKFNTLHLRDQLFYSIQWKLNKFQFEHILRSTNSYDELLKETTNMIDFTMKTPVEDVEVHHFPLEIISEILQQQQFNLPCSFRENVIEALTPLLVKNYPSPEMCHFFSLYCRDSPRSQSVIEMFTPTVQKILKHNTDFSECLRMRTLVQEYLLALNSQNNGLRVVEDFVKRMHRPTMICPFLRVLSNFISVCIAGINQFFLERKRLRFEDEEKYRAYDEKTGNDLVCYTKILQTISTFYDWRRHLSLVLQPVPFSNEALTHNRFIGIFKNVVQNFVDDTRCLVHQSVLGIRQGKDGWFEMFCVNGIACNDNGKMFSLMLDKLLSCCCRKRSFLLTINRLLPSLMLLALRGSQSSLDTLCAMLDLDAFEDQGNKSRVMSTLKSIPGGLQMYAKVRQRKWVLQEVRQKNGPRELTLPSHSTDSDLARLLSTDSFANLESLSLAFTDVTSACAEHLIKLTALRNLNLWSTRFGDAGLEVISNHVDELEELNLGETLVTDIGLTYLADMTTLQHLNLSGTRLSALAIEALKEKLPALKSCDIRYTDPD